MQQLNRLPIPVNPARCVSPLIEGLSLITSVVFLWPLSVTSRARHWRLPVDCSSVSQGSINYAMARVFVCTSWCVSKCVRSDRKTDLEIERDIKETQETERGYLMATWPFIQRHPRRIGGLCAWTAVCVCLCVVHMIGRWSDRN